MEPEKVREICVGALGCCIEQGHSLVKIIYRERTGLVADVFWRQWHGKVTRDNQAFDEALRKNYVVFVRCDRCQYEGWRKPNAAECEAIASAMHRNISYPQRPPDSENIFIKTPT